MSKIEVGRYSGLLRRSLGMKGQQDVAADLSPELSPTWQLESDKPEWSYLKEVKELGFSERILANAGGGGRARIRNPGGSGILCVISHLRVSSNAAAILTARIGVTGLDLANGGIGVARDTRWRQTAFTQSAMALTFQSTPGTIGAGVGTLFVDQPVVLEPYIYEAVIILAPGFEVDWGSNTVNTNISCTAVWTERQLPPLEAAEN